MCLFVDVYKRQLEVVSALSGKTQPIARDWDKDVWELYNLNEDFNERTDLAKK